MHALHATSRKTWPMSFTFVGDLMGCNQSWRMAWGYILCSWILHRRTPYRIVEWVWAEDDILYTEHQMEVFGGPFCVRLLEETCLRNPTRTSPNSNHRSDTGSNIALHPQTVAGSRETTSAKSTVKRACGLFPENSSLQIVLFLRPWVFLSSKRVWCCWG